MTQNPTLVPSIEKTWKHVERLLIRNGFKTKILDSEYALRKFIYKTIPDNCIVGLGNSLSSNSIKIREILIEKGNTVYFNWNGTSHNRSLDTFEELPRPDYFLTSVDISTEEGKIMNSEYSKSAVLEYNYPKNIIAFSTPKQLAKEKLPINYSSEYTVFKNKPSACEFTLAFVSFTNGFL